VNVMLDPNDPNKIQLLVKYRSAEHCTQLVKHMSEPIFKLNNLSLAAQGNVAPHYRPGQGGPR
jgi:hypothetical protein